MTDLMTKNLPASILLWCAISIGGQTHLLGQRIPHLDFDGDGIDDVALFRNNEGRYYFIPSSGRPCGEMGAAPVGAGCAIAFGLPGDWPLGGGFQGLGRSNFAIYRPEPSAIARWDCRPSNQAVFAIRPRTPQGWMTCGQEFYLVPDSFAPDLSLEPSFIPIVMSRFGYASIAWYDASRAQAFIRDPISARVLSMRDQLPGETCRQNGVLTRCFYKGVTLPVSGCDMSGDGNHEFTSYFVSNDNGEHTGIWSGGTLVWRTSAVRSYVPICLDFDGDERSDLALFDRANGTWLIRQTRTGKVFTVAWGLPDDIPLGGGDYNGDGVDDLLVYRRREGAFYGLGYLAETGTGSTGLPRTAAPHFKPGGYRIAWGLPSGWGYRDLPLNPAMLTYPEYW